MVTSFETKATRSLKQILKENCKLSNELLEKLFIAFYQFCKREFESFTLNTESFLVDFRNFYFIGYFVMK